MFRKTKAGFNERGVEQRLAPDTGTCLDLVDTFGYGRRCEMAARLRQYSPSGADLSVHSAAYLNAVAWQVNGRPRETIDWLKVRCSE